MDEVLQLFKKFDTDGNNIVSLTEIKEILMELDPEKWTAESVEELFREADENADEELTFEEFSLWLQNCDDIEGKMEELGVEGKVTATTKCTFEAEDGTEVAKAFGELSSDEVALWAAQATDAESELSDEESDEDHKKKRPNRDRKQRRERARARREAKLNDEQKGHAKKFTEKRINVKKWVQRLLTDPAVPEAVTQGVKEARQTFRAKRKEILATFKDTPKKKKMEVARAKREKRQTMIKLAKEVYGDEVLNSSAADQNSTAAADPGAAAPEPSAAEPQPGTPKAEAPNAEAETGNAEAEAGNAEAEAGNA